MQEYMDKQVGWPSFLGKKESRGYVDSVLEKIHERVEDLDFD